jgi:hypothetical protein
MYRLFVETHLKIEPVQRTGVEILVDLVTVL